MVDVLTQRQPHWEMRPESDIGVSPTVQSSGKTGEVQSYYSDSIASVAQDSHVRQTFPVASVRNPHSLEEFSVSVSEFLKRELEKAEIDFAKVQAEFCRLLSSEIRKNAKGHQEFLHSMEGKIQVTAKIIEDTHGGGWSVALTVVSSTVSIAGGLAGLTFLLPAGALSATTAEGLSRASMAIGNSGTAIGALGGLPKDRAEGRRVLPQVELRHYQEKHEGRTQSKSKDGQTIQANLEQARAQEEARHRAVETMMG